MVWQCVESAIDTTSMTGDEVRQPLDLFLRLLAKILVAHLNRTAGRGVLQLRFDLSQCIPYLTCDLFVRWSRSESPLSGSHS